MSAVDVLKATQQCTEPARCGCQWGAYWRNLTDTIELSICVGYAAFCQITLTTCSLLFLIVAAVAVLFHELLVYVNNVM